MCFADVVLMSLSMFLLADHYLKKELTTIEGFHSHLEGLWRIQSHEIQQHVSIKYLLKAHIFSSPENTHDIVWG